MVMKFWVDQAKITIKRRRRRRTRKSVEDGHRNYFNN
jgi:hypothetical protein